MCTCHFLCHPLAVGPGYIGGLGAKRGMATHPETHQTESSHSPCRGQTLESHLPENKLKASIASSSLLLFQSVVRMLTYVRISATVKAVGGANWRRVNRHGVHKFRALAWLAAFETTGFCVLTRPQRRLRQLFLGPRSSILVLTPWTHRQVV